jgi:hypothetical protein
LRRVVRDAGFGDWGLGFGDWRLDKCWPVVGRSAAIGPYASVTSRMRHRLGLVAVPQRRRHRDHRPLQRSDEVAPERRAKPCLANLLHRKKLGDYRAPLALRSYAALRQFPPGCEQGHLGSESSSFPSIIFSQFQERITSALWVFRTFFAP